jgi:hypothetical protein
MDVLNKSHELICQVKTNVLTIADKFIILNILIDFVKIYIYIKSLN